MFYRKIRPIIISFLLPAAAALYLAGCDNGSDDGNNNAGNTATTFKVVPLVADTADLGAPVIDSNLANPWGLAPNVSGNFWIADNHTGMSSIYDAQGTSRGTAVKIPGVDDTTAGAPTGMVANSSDDFKLPDGRPAQFLFAGEDGIVTGWDTGSAAVKVIDRSDSETVYKGMALASDSGKNFLYLANFRGRRVEVYDATFQPDPTRAFADTSLPSDYGPFNILAAGDKIYVAYAKLKGPDNEDDEKGPGNGYVNIFTPGGVLVRRFVSNAELNSPWGMAWIDDTYGPFKTGLLVGNFGDGTIAAYDTAGVLQGQVKDAAGALVKIEGLWALYHPAGSKNLYFTAGPKDEAHGVFGYLTAN